MKRLFRIQGSPGKIRFLRFCFLKTPADAMAPLALADFFQRLRSGELGDLSTRAPRCWSGEEVWGGSLGRKSGELV